ncbi:hypothetical protein [Kitasatospora purpeofusca]
MKQVEGDFMVWEDRQFSSHPKLIAGDGPIMLLRRWADQFGTEPR